MSCNSSAEVPGEENRSQNGGARTSSQNPKLGVANLALGLLALSNQRMRLLIVPLLLGLAACASSRGGSDAGPLDVAALLDGGSFDCSGFADDRFVATFPLEWALVASAATPDDAGLVGRNHGYARMVSARFQLGAGLLARVGVENLDADTAADGLRAIEAGLTSVDGDGVVVSEVPPDAPVGSVLKPIDVASAAAFFLGDACQGLLSLERAPATWGLGPRLEAVRPVVARALGWLDTQVPILLDGDGAAPNRLLFDARAFAACGGFAHAPQEETAGRFVDAFVALARADGAYAEGGGFDTSYQGVALAIGRDVQALAPQARCVSLGPALWVGARWLAGRVDAAGRLDSTGNSRTCGGGESFLGRAKDVDLAHAVRGLASVAAATGAPALLEAARRLSGWARQTSSSCFP